MDRPRLESDILGAYGRYPLIVKIPSAVMTGGTLGFRYTEYKIEVDDCGRCYSRQRRYTMFAWLHAELRRRELACALPELPPKKILGNRDTAFVERRRQQLEDYLKALLMLPAVIQDGMIWAFLDADEATAVVPRFLCRPATHHAADKCLSALKRAVADKETEIFRLCDASVLEELASFAKAEASEEAVVAVPQQAQQLLQVRLWNRIKLCFILLQVICYDRARHKLVQSGVFGALLALLCRATEDEAAARSSDSWTENHHNGSLAATDCVKRLIQVTQGEALLVFCQQDGALDALRRLATAESEVLHAVCAWLLWFGLRCGGVVAALAGTAGGSNNRGLSLLGRLLKSPDLGARALASLCIGCIVREEGVLDADSREHCLEALAPLSAEMDAREKRFLSDAARCALAGPAKETGRCPSVSGSLAASEAPTVKESVASADSARTLRLSVSAHREDKPEEAPKVPVITRDPNLVKLLAEICSPKELPRLQVLLGLQDDGGEYGGVDTVTAAAVAVLDHFVQHSVEKDSAKLRELQPLMPQLQQLVEGGDDGQMVEGGVGGAAAGEPPGAQVSREEVRVRAARILVRVKEAQAEAACRVPPELPAFGSRTRILEVLMRHSDTCQASAGGRILQFREHCQAQSEHIVAGNLGKAPCVSEKDFQGFLNELGQLTLSRRSLSTQMTGLQKALEDMNARLDQNRVRHGILAKDVFDLNRNFEELAGESTRTAEVLAELKRCEEEQRKSNEEVDHLTAQQREAKVVADNSSSKAAEAEALAKDLSKREADLAEFCHTAPAQLERCQAKLADVSEQRAHFGKLRAELSMEADRCERHQQGLQEALKEADAALKATALVGRELEALRPSLNSELIMTDAEVAQIQALEAKSPSKPARLRQKERRSSESSLSKEPRHWMEEAQFLPEESPISSEVLASEAEADGPSWDDAGAEQEFHSAQHFRAFKRLNEERERLWQEERRWLKGSLEQCESNLSKLQKQCQEAESQERQAHSAEDELRKEIAVLDDAEAHGQRVLDACAAAEAAHASHKELQSAAVEAAGAQQMAAAHKEQAMSRAEKVNAQLEIARVAAEGEEKQTLKVRQDLQLRFVEVEKRVRDFIQEWRCLEQEEQRLAVLQEHVDEGLRSEADGRQRVRAEVQILVESLRELDHQLDQPEASL
ncbi:unnamed protein product [Effrenium voratum]|uniref:PX domain-containing protein n=1 Tax=Effrenium voratum TaxID=2562239 RepID=A0AA36JA11_9DINO|nr:unnamed protein product [Effrenium voratum]CAJ1413737.1 unnamed protein product [Effrenium voratum]